MLERVAAVDAATFGAVHWGRAPLLSRASDLANGSQLDDLFSADAVDELISRRGLRTPFLRLAKDGSVLAPARFTRGGGAGAGAPDQVADDKVLALLDGGATLVLQGLHRTWAPIIDFANELSAELGHPVQVNAYITPPQNQGFAAHYDVHDVFVMQISGAKQWRIHAPVLVDPLSDQNWESRRAEVAARAGETPIIDTTLTPGDVLYLPRGYLHSAQALGDFSIHLTVGVHPVTRYRVVRELLAGSSSARELRRSLPMGVDLGDPSVLAAQFEATVAALHEHLDQVEPSSIARALAGELRDQTRAEPIAPLAALRAAAQLRPDTPLRLRRGLRAAITTSPDAVELTLVDSVVRFPLAADAALKVVLDGLGQPSAVTREFTPAELPGLDPDEQLVLGRRLLREGIAVPA